MIEPTKRAAPYLPFLTFMNSFDSLSQGVPPKLDRTLWRSQSGLMQGQIMNSYRFFGLVDEEQGDAPTQELENMAKHPEQRSDILRALVEAQYAEALEAHDITKMTMKMLEECFEKSFSVTGATKQKAIAFFLKAAKFSDMPLSPYLQSQIRNVGARKKRAPKNGTVEGTASEMAPPAVAQPQGTSRTVELRSGGNLTLTLSVKVFDLQRGDREFVFEMIDKLQEYEDKKETASE